MNITDQSIITPLFQDNTFKMTPAMYFAYQGIIPPQELYHSPSLQDVYGKTVAMILTLQSIIVPDEWKHDYRITDNYGLTIAFNLALYGIVYNDNWIYTYIPDTSTVPSTVSYPNTTAHHIVQNTLTHPQYIQMLKGIYATKIRLKTSQRSDKQSIRNMRVYVLKKQICDVCHQTRQKFVKTHCGDKICSQCQSKLYSNRREVFCPVCFSQFWINFTFDKLFDQIINGIGNDDC